MGLRNAGTAPKDMGRVVAHVPGVSGDYASERIVFGVPTPGVYSEALLGVTVQVEDAAAGMTVELWLPRVASGSVRPEDLTDGDYFYAGQSIPAAGEAALTAHQATSATWTLAAYPGCQIRVKSGGTAGTVGISASAY